MVTDETVSFNVEKEKNEKKRLIFLNIYGYTIFKGKEAANGD